MSFWKDLHSRRRTRLRSYPDDRPASGAASHPCTTTRRPVSVSAEVCVRWRHPGFAPMPSTNTIQQSKKRTGRVSWVFLRICRWIIDWIVRRVNLEAEIRLFCYRVSKIEQVRVLHKEGAGQRCPLE